MKYFFFMSLLAMQSVQAETDAVQALSYQYKESKLANYVPKVMVSSIADMTKTIRVPQETFGTVLLPTTVEVAKSAGNALALLSGIVEYQVFDLRKNDQSYSLNIQPFLGGNYNMLIQHRASLETSYSVSEVNGNKVHKFSFGNAKVMDTRPWNEKMAIYVSPEITTENVNRFFSNASVFHKFSVKNENCKELQKKINDKVANYGYADYIMDREIKFSEKSSLMFKVKLDKTYRVNFAIDPAVKDGMCTAYIQSFASKSEVDGFDFDAQILKTISLLQDFAAHKEVDLGNIEVVQPPKPVQIGRQ